MNLLKSVELKVGLLVLTVAGLVSYMSIQVSDDPSYVGKSQKAWFVLDDASGLVKNSAVKMAGIPVGSIRDIKLENGRARVEIVVKADLGLRTSARVEIKAAGILGDKHVEVIPGNPADSLLADGSEIKSVKDKGSLDSLFSQVGEIGNSLSSVAKTLEASVKGDGQDKDILGRIVINIEKVTKDLAGITSENRQDISAIVKEVRGISKSLNDLINDTSDQGFKKTWKRSLANIDQSLKNLNEITTKVNKGEGTIGKLLNDSTTVDEVNTALEGINGFLDSANKVQTGIEFHNDYLGSIGASKSYIGVKIQPGLDRHYEFGIVDDPAGVAETIQTKTTQASGVTEISETKRYMNRTKMSFLYAKNFYDFSVKGGLIENSGGLAFDQYFLRKKMRFTAEAYEFSKLNLRVSLKYDVLKSIYVYGGLSDVLNNSGRNSAYVGAGLFLTNDDLKILGSKLPF